MDSLIIKGGTPLKGRVKIGGAKNSALKLMCAALLTDKPLILHNIPQLADITTMSRLLVHHGVKISSPPPSGRRLGGGLETLSSQQPTLSQPLPEGEENSLRLQADNITDLTAPYELVKLMRASIIVLGPLLARFGQAKVSLPGGCAIGSRPVDLHLKALEKMGAEIEITDGYVIAKCKKLKAAEIFFEKVSVGATENILMAATLAKGETVLNNAAQEPEITDLCECLIKMGAKITGIGTNRITIQGVETLNGAEHTTVADRIETGSFIAASAITGGEIELINANADHLGAVLHKFEEAGVYVEKTAHGLRVKKPKEIKSINIITEPYPGFPTDMQAQFMTLMTLATGISKIEETIFENRFMHVPELSRMGAKIKVTGNTAIVTGIEKLNAAEVMATDLRASFSLVIAALAAEGETKITRVYHIDRGYEKIARRLQGLGADIVRVKV